MFGRYAVVVVPRRYDQDGCPDFPKINNSMLVSIHLNYPEAVSVSRSENMGRDYSSTQVMGVTEDDFLHEIFRL